MIRRIKKIKKNPRKNDPVSYYALYFNDLLKYRRNHVLGKTNKDEMLVLV